MSERCSSPYTDLCGTKSYDVTYISGAALPFPVTIVENTATGQFELTVITNDPSFVGEYDVRIKASFVTYNAL